MKRITATLALALLIPALAGCLQNEDLAPQTGSMEELTGLSEAIFDLLPGESVFHAASMDGTQLHLRLYRPDTSGDPEWKAPTILVMSPYFGPDSREQSNGDSPPTGNPDPAAKPAYWRYQWLVDHFVPRGYAVAFSDVRGTGESGGCLEQTGPKQTQDGYDVVEFLAGQPWSNGKVGMYGKSYDGETQQSTATLAPPGLVTIVPLSSVAGQYDYSYYDGVPYTLQTMLSNAGYAAGDGLQPGSTVEAHLTYPQRVGCNVDHFRQGADSSGTWNGYWEEREIRMHAADVKASVLYVHGLQDWNVKPSNIRDWFERLDVPKLALLGQWEHDYPEENRFVADWSRQDWQELVWRWYDHWLLGRDNGIAQMLGQVQIQDSEGRWRVEEAFPPANTSVQMWLADGKLVPTETTGAAAKYSEGTPIPLGITDFIGSRSPSGVFYESAALEAPLHWSGWPTLTLDIALDKNDAHFAVHMLDVAPDGSSTWVNRAYLSAQHRDGIESAKPVPVGETVTYTLRFFPSDTIIPTGHKLALALMASDDWTDAANNGHTATVHGGVLTLPTVTPSADAFFDAPMGGPIKAPVV